MSVTPNLVTAMTLRVKFFGKFELEFDGVPVDGIRSTKSREVLAYLLLRREPQSRDALASLIWGDQASTEQSRKYLRNTLWQLQKNLAQFVTSDRQVLEINARSISIDASLPLWSDVEQFEAAYEEVRDVDGTELDADQVARVREAIALYTGSFLEGWFTDWCLVYRERTQHLALLILDKLMDNAATNREYESGILYGERILSYDRAREVTHRKLMKLLYFSGDRTGALRQFNLCEEILQEELAISPSELTLDVLEAIRNDSLGGNEPKGRVQN